MTDITPQAREAAEPWWLIYYEDASCTPEVFNDEQAARRAFDMRQVSWTCHLFSNESAVQSLLSTRDARIAELEQKLSNELTENRKLKKSSAVYDFQEFVIQQERRLSEILLSPPSPSAVTDDSPIQPKEDEK